MLIPWLANATPQKIYFTADAVLSPYVYVFYAAFIVAFLFTPVMKAVASYYGIVDQPDQLRKMHSKPIAYLGGVAVFLGWMAGLAMSQFVGMHAATGAGHILINFSIVIGASAIVILGLWDDVRHIGPWVKIGGQVLAALFLMWHGIGTDSTASLLTPVHLTLRHTLGWSFVTPGVVHVTSFIMTIFVVVACCNATNLMDGLDGLCGGVTAIIAGGFCFIAVVLAMRPFGLYFNPNQDGLRVVLALALLGAVLGFVPFNFSPASIFMGDTGSMFLGFSCATLILLSAQNQEPKWFLASLVMFALPILDTALAFARRMVNRRSLFAADRHHFHHQMVARGLTVKRTVLLAYGLALFFVIGGGAIAFLRTRYVVAAYLVIFGFMIVTAFKMGMVHEQPRVINRRRSDDNGPSLAPLEAETVSVIEIRDE